MRRQFLEYSKKQEWRNYILKTILIIDDDMHIGNMLEETLVREGYGVQRAYSGTEALLLLADAKPDLVLLDLMLPGLCGEEVLPQIKGIPVIVHGLPCSCAMFPIDCLSMFYRLGI